MEQKLAAVFVRVSADRRSVTEICAELRISRATFYKYQRRFAEEGLDGLAPRSRRPASCPTATAEDVVGAVLAARRALAVEGWVNGSISIWHRMTADGSRPPSVRTIHRILTRHGVVEPDPSKRPRASYRRFAFPATDDCWQIDAFEWALADGATVVVFSVLDDHSRYDLADLAWPVEDTAGAWQAFTNAVQRYGQPRIVLADNGLAFTGKHLKQQVLFEKNLAAIGVTLINSRPRHPQTTGKNERSHQTLQRWLRARPAARTLAELQTLLDEYRHAYNRRPHQALAGRTPLEQRAAGTRTTPHQPITALPAPTHATTITADNRGDIHCFGVRVHVGTEYRGQTITAFRTGDHFLAFYQHHTIRDLTLDPTRKNQAPRPRQRPTKVPA